MNKCGTCKWWRRDCYGYAGTPIGEYEDYGQCQKIYEEQSPLVALLTAKTYAVLTLADFGCVLWEDNGALMAD